MEKHKELWGRKFRIVKNGLDESDVASFIDTLRGPDFDLDGRLERLDSLIASLTEKYGELAGRFDLADSEAGPSEGDADCPGWEKLQHLDSLTRFAQRTIVEADKEAEKIKAEAEEKAQSILEQARARAEQEALLVKQEVEQLLVRSKQLLENEIGTMFHQASQQLSADPPGAVETPPDSISDQHTPDPSELEEVAYGQSEAPEEAHEQSADSHWEGHSMFYADPYEDTVELAVTPTALDSQ